jgi:hypothetical protein
VRHGRLSHIFPLADMVVFSTFLFLDITHTKFNAKALKLFELL